MMEKNGRKMDEYKKGRKEVSKEKINIFHVN
jgi:hypothetical protein